MYKLIILLLAFTAKSQSFQWAIHQNNYWADDGKSIGMDKLGNLYVTGESYYSSGNNTYNSYQVLYKFSPSGSSIFQATLDIAALKSTTDPHGNTYVIGSAKVNKYNTNGQLIWSQPFNGNTLLNVVEHPYGGVVVSGFVNFIGKSLIMRLNPSGSVVWSRIGDFTTGISTPICTDKNGVTYFAAKDSTSLGFVSKVDSLGNIISSFTVANNPQHVSVSDDLSIYIHSEGTNSSYIQKYSPSGSLLWSCNILGNYYGITDIISDSYNDLYLMGFFNQNLTVGSASLSTLIDDMFIIKLNSQGNVTTTKTTIGTSGAITPLDIVRAPNNDLFITGTMNGKHSFDLITLNGPPMYPDLFVCKFSGGVITKNEKVSNSQNDLDVFHFAIFPSPTTGLFQIQCHTKTGEEVRITILNSLGQRVYSERGKSGETYNKYFDFTGMAKGIYFVEMVAGKSRNVRKVVLE